MRWRPLATTVLSICALSASALAQQASPAWSSGFEEGFPGEWLDWDDGSFTSNGTVNSGMSEAWTIVRGGDVTYAGDHVYRGWPVAQKSDSHRAYPVIHVDIPSPLVNSFMVYLDVDYNALSDTDWVHFATWGNNPDWNVHTLSVRDRKLEMAHLSWRYIGPGSQPDFPLRRWVRLTTYIHYQGSEGTVRLWQDGVPMLEGTYTQAAGRNLMRAHWGWYSNGAVTRGVQYNDEIQIWTLSGPLQDLESEPPSPYLPAVGTPGSGSAAAGAGGAATIGGAAGGNSIAGMSNPGTAGRAGSSAAQGGQSAGRAGQGPMQGGQMSGGGLGGDLGTAGSSSGAGVSVGGMSAGGLPSTGGGRSGTVGGRTGAGSAAIAGSASPGEEPGTAGASSMNGGTIEAGCGCGVPGRNAGQAGGLAAASLLFAGLLRRRSERRRSHKL